jgi:hypothetical protein
MQGQSGCIIFVESCKHLESNPMNFVGDLKFYPSSDLHTHVRIDIVLIGGHCTFSAITSTQSLIKNQIPIISL